MSRTLLIIPVHNEAPSVRSILMATRRYFSDHILIINDGSTDGTTDELKKLDDHSLSIICREKNKGYGASLIEGFQVAIDSRFDYAITMDADWQHEPCRIPSFFEALDDFDVVSGSRYLEASDRDSDAPLDRRSINQYITKLINGVTHFQLTDSFCGFKLYRTEALKRLSLDESGYAFPLQFWIQAYHHKLRIREIPVPRIYLDAKRSFGAHLDDPAARRHYYEQVLTRECRRWQIPFSL
ncbi:MAG: glycosyltransferase family 2 protein [Bdellovibrionota bacterium]|nr:MAG: glycosyltransferase family 2 protein [Bdellovibrionota bacterium]